MAVLKVNPEVAPGETIVLHAYITGYGVIDGVKLMVYFPPGLVDAQHSRVLHGLKETSSEFGAQSERVDDTGVAVTLTRFEEETEQSNRLFSDHEDETDPEGRVKIIVSERKVINAPIEAYLKTKGRKCVKTGKHDVQFHLTYFNGSQWQTSSQVVDVLVKSWVQRHERGLSIVGVIAAGIAVFSFMVNIAINRSAIWCAVMNILS